MRVLLASLPILLVGLAGCLSDGGITGLREDCPDDDVVVERDLVVEVLTGSGRTGDPASRSFPWPLGDNLSAEWQGACFGAVEATIAWENTPSQGADLFVGIDVPSTGLSVKGSDRQQFVLDGAHEETVLVAAGWEGLPSDQVRDGLVLVVYSDWASLSQDGLPVHATLTLHPAA